MRIRIVPRLRPVLLTVIHRVRLLKEIVILHDLATTLTSTKVITSPCSRH